MEKLLAKIRGADILILDDWGLSKLNPIEGRFLYDIFEDRYNERSTIISSQLPVAKWHELFFDATVADAVLDRVVHNSHRIELHGASLRRPPINTIQSSNTPNVDGIEGHVGNEWEGGYGYDGE
jgi:DNA replication protein DnaC